METSGAVKIPDDVLYQEVKQEVVLLNLNNQTYYGLNEAGAAMWKLIAECGDRDAVVGRMCEMFDVTPDVVRADLDKLLTDLASHGLVRQA